MATKARPAPAPRPHGRPNRSAPAPWPPASLWRLWLGLLWRRHRKPVLRGVVLLGLLAAVAVAVAWPHWQRGRQGAALFDGRAPLRAKLSGHDNWLPPEVARCVNCHNTAGYAPPLRGADLRQAQARRGGPPSSYDAAALCRLLRTGVDPAWVTLPRAMPRYELSTAECEALWSHLSQRG